jgi:hypothetical protein
VTLRRRWAGLAGVTVKAARSGGYGIAEAGGSGRACARRGRRRLERWRAVERHGAEPSRAEPAVTLRRRWAGVGNRTGGARRRRRHR